MRKIILNKTVTYHDKNTPPVTYSEMLSTILNNPPQGGFDVQGMSRTVHILELVRKNSVLLLEEQDYVYLLSRIAECKWIIADAAILAFVDDIKNAPQAEVKEKK